MTIHIVGDTTLAKKAIAAEMRRAIEQFLSLGVSQIEQACNRRRVAFIADFRARDPADLKYLHPSLANVTTATGIQELDPPFQLHEAPDPIVVDLRRDEKAPGSPVPMEMYVGTGHILVYALRIDATTLQVRGAVESVADLAFHEMLHVSGDLKNDGIVRHNVVGVGAINELVATL